ncbi:MAG: hypothetical protein R6X33_03805 [Candidatus Brocadiia bacterium]
MADRSRPAVAIEREGENFHILRDGRAPRPFRPLRDMHWPNWRASS